MKLIISYGKNPVVDWLNGQEPFDHDVWVFYVIYSVNTFKILQRIL